MIKEAKGSLGSELTLEDVHGHGGLSDLSKVEGGGRSIEKGNDGKLHLVYVLD